MLSAESGATHSAVVGYNEGGDGIVAHDAYDRRDHHFEQEGREVTLDTAVRVE